jgi:hypothetical protein
VRGTRPFGLIGVEKDLGIQRQEEAKAALERNRLRRLLGARGVRVVSGDD